MKVGRLKVKGWIKTGIKILVTVAGLWYVLSQISLDEIASVVAMARWGWLGLALALMVASLVVRAFRWRVLLLGLGVEVGFGRLITLYFIGNFFNAFLPSGFGGDVVRAVGATRDLSAEISAGTVILDRFTGLIALFGMALLALPFRPDTFPTDWFWIILLLASSGVIGGGLFLSGRLTTPLTKHFNASNPINRLLQTMQLCDKRSIIVALLVSVVFNLMLVGWWYAVGQALSLDINYLYQLLVVPILSLALLIPSVGGLGVRESLAPLLFVGISAENAVALSLIVFILLRLTSLIGAPLYLISNRS